MSGDPVEVALDRLSASPLRVGSEYEVPHEVYDAIEALMAAIGSDDIAEILALAATAGRISTRDAICYANMAAWCGTDNGAAMSRTLFTWVRAADDGIRLAIALHHEIYPLPTRAEMVPKLTEIAHRFPEHREVCAGHITTRPPD